MKCDECVRYRISPECRAEVRFQGKPTQPAIDKLIKNLELMKDTLSTTTVDHPKGG